MLTIVKHIRIIKLTTYEELCVKFSSPYTKSNKYLPHKNNNKLKKNV